MGKNVHKVEENRQNREVLWDFFDFGEPPWNETLGKQALYKGHGVSTNQAQLGVVVQGDYGPAFCPLMGLVRQNKRIHKTFPVNCSATGPHDMGILAGDYFCTDQVPHRDIIVSPPCHVSNTKTGNAEVLQMSDHAIVSLHVNGTKRAI